MWPALYPPGGRPIVARGLQSLESVFVSFPPGGRTDDSSALRAESPRASRPAAEAAGNDRSPSGRKLAVHAGNGQFELLRSGTRGNDRSTPALLISRSDPHAAAITPSAPTGRPRTFRALRTADPPGGDRRTREPGSQAKLLWKIDRGGSLTSARRAGPNTERERTVARAWLPGELRAEQPCHRHRIIALRPLADQRAGQCARLHFAPTDSAADNKSARGATAP